MRASSVNSGGACFFGYALAVRLLLTLVALLALAVGVYLAYPTYIAPRLERVPAPVVADQQACLDACEQTAIVGQTAEAALRACRATCGGGTAGAQRRPNEPIRSISRAPADHRAAPLPAPKPR